MFDELKTIFQSVSLTQGIKDVSTMLQSQINNHIPTKNASTPSTLCYKKLQWPKYNPQFQDKKTSLTVSGAAKHLKAFAKLKSYQLFYAS